MAKRVLILSAKAGAGHIRAADALEEAFRAYHPDVQVEHVEALSHTNRLFSRCFTGAYNLLAGRWPLLWGLLYEAMDKKGPETLSRRLGLFLDRFNAKGVARLVQEMKPDAVISTHFLPPEVLGPLRLKGTLRTRLYTVVTDYDIHSMWISAGTDEYFVASEEIVAAMRARGVNAAITVTGIPIMSAFSQEFPNRPEMRAQLGYRSEPKTALVAAGGFGLSRIDETVAMLAKEVDDVQIIALAGKNKRLFAALQKIAESHPGRIVPLEYSTTIWQLMAASDFMVSKAGGLTVSECMAMGLPLIVFNPIPGQEERNADYLMEHGAAWRARGEGNLAYKFKKLLETPAQLESMKLAALELGKARAAKTIADKVASDIRP